jgi:glycosyltransferase involved in cell wall biosynthesis
MDRFIEQDMTYTPHQDRKLRILYLITGLRLGGAERQLLLLAAHIQAKGQQVLVVAMEGGGVLAADFRGRKIEVLELDIKGAGSLFHGYQKLKKIIKDFSPDLIHSHMIHANLFSRIFKLFNPQYKLVNTAHNIIEGSRLLMRGYTWTSMLSDWSTNVSREAFDHYIQKGYFSRTLSCYIPNAVDTLEFSPNEDERLRLRNEFDIDGNAYVFFSAGRLHDQKDHELLLRSFKILLDQSSSAILVIAGEGPLYVKLKKLTVFLGIADQTLFLGRRADIPSLLNMCDCFVLSSKYEGFGLVTAEALATMKPVIATDCGGVREVIGEYGTLVKTGDLLALSSAMVTEMNFSTTNEQLSNGRRHIEENYSIDTVIGQWLHLYYHQI